MKVQIIAVVVLALGLVLSVLVLSVRVVKQHQLGVLFRLGRPLGARAPELRLIIPVVDVLHRLSLRIVTMPIQSEGITTRGNVSVDVSALPCSRIFDAVKLVVGTRAEALVCCRRGWSGSKGPGSGD
jgi:regulator of protease activity HflC (stomatin/prohibitin superfamily)